MKTLLVIALGALVAAAAAYAFMDAAAAKKRDKKLAANEPNIDEFYKPKKFQISREELEKFVRQQTEQLRFSSVDPSLKMVKDGLVIGKAEGGRTGRTNRFQIEVSKYSLAHEGPALTKEGNRMLSREGEELSRIRVSFPPKTSVGGYTLCCLGYETVCPERCYKEALESGIFHLELNDLHPLSLDGSIGGKEIHVTIGRDKIPEFAKNLKICCAHAIQFLTVDYYQIREQIRREGERS